MTTRRVLYLITSASLVGMAALALAGEWWAVIALCLVAWMAMTAVAVEAERR